MNTQDTEGRKLPTRAAAWDTLIVGAGPAGLFTALSLAAAGIETLVIDAGPNVDERALPQQDSTPSRAEYERGVGGAGLFSDGKLCLSLDVGGHLETTLDKGERADLLTDIEGVFEQLLEPRLQHARGDDLEAAHALATRAGLTFKHYPVAHIGTDRCHDVIRQLRSIVAGAGTTIRAETELADLSLGPNGTKLATLKSEEGAWQIQVENVVLAMGKVGADREAEFCHRLGIASDGQPLYVGLRFEAPAEAVAPLFAHAKDPKYSFRCGDGSKVKTHCASEQGEVIALHYGALPLAGGHNYSWAKTERSGFSILWDGLSTGGDGYRTAVDLMSRAQAVGKGRLVAQRLIDYQQGAVSVKTDLAKLPLSCPDWVAGDVREILPDDFFPRADEFLGRLEMLAPGLTDHAVFYAPAIEWWMKRVAVNETMATIVPGVFVAGDGSGWSQGIVHAAATGILAATGISGERPDLAEWVAEHNSADRREFALA